MSNKKKPEAPRSLQSLTWIKAAFNNNATALSWPSWRESATAGHNFGRGPSNDYSIKVWFQTRWFLCEFPIGSYVKLSTAVQPSWSEGRTTRHKYGSGEDLNVIFYQNMPNLHNRYKSAERKISKKNPEHMLNYSLPCSCSSNLSSF